MAKANAAKLLISDVGKQLLAQNTCPNKGSLVKLLKQAASAFPELKQSALLKPDIKPLSDSLIKHRLLQHRDKDIRLLVAICFCEVIRVLAPNPNFSDAVFKDIFKLFLSMFVELSDTTSPYFPRRVTLLETVAKLNFCLLMLDIGCEVLVLEMFNIFFNVVREDHQQSLVNAMSSMMAGILREKASELLSKGEVSEPLLKEEIFEPLLDVVLLNLLNEAKGASPAASRLAVSVIQNCCEVLEPFVCMFLTSCILNRDALRSELKEFYHEIIFEVFRCAPQMLLAVLPNLAQELLTDQVDARIKALNLMGRLFALPGHNIALEYRHLFIEFLNRFPDKSVEVRLVALLCAKAFYTNNPSGTESLEVLTALEGRLLDFDDRVRTQAVSVVCDLARFNMKSFPPELVSRAAERLRDKKVSVRKRALQKLLEVYQDYCIRCSGGTMTLSEHFEQIPCRILLLCYDKDCKEFRPQSLELVLAEDMFPAALPIEERTRHWIFLFTLFTPRHINALNAILSQKRRLRTEIQVYLALRKEEKDSEEVEKRTKASFMKMSATFADPAKAEEGFHKLNVMKDNGIFNALVNLLGEVAIKDAQATRDNFLSMIGHRDGHDGFFQLLSTKCLFNIFSSEHVLYIIDHLSSDRFGNKHLEDSSVRLLLTIISAFPSLLKDSENQFRRLLLEEVIPFNEDLIQMLAKSGPHLSVQLSDIYSSLERICVDGTRAQSRLAVSAIAALAGTSEQVIFSELCKTLVNSLRRGQNVPTVLQSLGCMAQHSVSTFEDPDRKITQLIHEKIFRVADVDVPDDVSSFGETSECSVSCKLKIFGLKALVKSFLPHHGALVSRKINNLLDILSPMLPKGDISTISSESDKAHIRLAAAKSVLRLSRRWDLHISPRVFCLTILMARDPSPLVRRLFVNKTHKLLMEHAIPVRYACVFALASSDSLKDLQDNSLKFMGEFIREYSRKARMHPTSLMKGGVNDYPACIVVYLIHVLAHDTNFPTQDCQDEEIYAQFCSPLVFTLEGLVNASLVDGDVEFVNDSVSYLCGIFHAVKRAEDAVDADATPKLHSLADFGICILNALDHATVSVSHTPGSILLPSSLYKISSEKREANLSLMYVSDFEKNISMKLVNSFESHLPHPASTLAKRGRRSREASSESDVIAISKKVDQSMYGKRDQNKSQYVRGKELRGKKLHEKRKRESNNGGEQRHALSSCPHGSVELHNEFSIIEDEHESLTFGNSELIIRKDQLPSSCDSAPKETSQPQKEDLLSSNSLKENETFTECKDIAAKSRKNSRANCKELCHSQRIGNGSESLLGQRIKLWSPIDKCYYSGTVVSFDSRNSTHKINYDNGEVELVSLKNEKWEALRNDLLQDKDSSGLHSCNFDHGEHSSQREIVDAFGDDSKQPYLPQKEKMNFLGRQRPTAVNRMKGQKISVDTSASEVINANEDAIARRTRRRKV